MSDSTLSDSHLDFLVEKWTKTGSCIPGGVVALLAHYYSKSKVGSDNDDRGLPSFFRAKSGEQP